MALEIDYTKDDQILQVYPQLPLLSSRGETWRGLHLGYYRQPAHETPEHFAKQYIIGIDLEQPVRASDESHQKRGNCGGTSCIYPANYTF